MKKIEKVRIIPLGGLNEIGKNMTLVECGKDIIMIDCGMAFPDEEMPGVDYVIPDIQYVVKNVDRLRAIFLTHGHEDHIGALPYVLKQINVPIYGTRMTLGIVTNKLREFHLEKRVTMMEVSAGDVVSAGNFRVEYIHTTHSIADSAALALHTPCGVILHTGDFKVDLTPIESDMIDLTRFGELGKEGVLALMSDSTNAERPGYTPSESTVGNTLDDIFRKAGDKRIIVATFSSNVHRVQQVINMAIAYDRKVALSGRSMSTVIDVANQLGYMKIPKGLLIDIDKIKKYPSNKLVIVTTGSQGEPMSALYRMAFSEHKTVEIGDNDLVVISASAIPGNEKLVYRMINELSRAGAEVVDDALDEVHASGHAAQEDLKLILGLTRPKYFIPVHGEYRHLKTHASLATAMGVPEENIVITSIGNIIELSPKGIDVVGTVPSGKVLVDGLGVGDVGNVVLRDRKHLSNDGLIVAVAVVDEAQRTIVCEPEILTRGFVYMKENEDLIQDVRDLTTNIILKCANDGYEEWVYNARTKLRDALSKYVYDKTKRSPMILTILKNI